MRARAVPACCLCLLLVCAAAARLVPRALFRPLPCCLRARNIHTLLGSHLNSSSAVRCCCLSRSITAEQALRHPYFRELREAEFRQRVRTAEPKMPGQPSGL